MKIVRTDLVTADAFASGMTTGAGKTTMSIPIESACIAKETELSAVQLSETCVLLSTSVGRTIVLQGICKAACNKHEPNCTDIPCQANFNSYATELASYINKQ